MKARLQFALPVVFLITSCGSRPTELPLSPDRESVGVAPERTGHLAENPTPIPRVELPDGWVPRTSKNKNVRQAAGLPELEAHFTLAMQPCSEFSDDLRAFAEATKRATEEQTSLTNRTESELREVEIGNDRVIEYRIEGSAGKNVGHGRVMMLRKGDWFCKLLGWTIPIHWDAAQPKFEELVENLRLIE